MWGDEAGAGKTTNAGRGAAARDRRHAILFDKHQKAREFARDEATPGGYTHLKGAEQKRHDECMDADHAGEPCPIHDDTDACPSMCPVYDLSADHPVRQRYEALVAEVGPTRTHRILKDDLPGHDEDGTCLWLEKLGEIGRAERIIGVHEYQTLKTVREHADHGARDIIVDESPRVTAADRTLDVEDLVRLGNRLETVGRCPNTPDALTDLATFAEQLVDLLTGGCAAETIADLAPPDIDAETITVEVDPDDLPADVDPDDVRKAAREPVGMPEAGYRSRVDVVDRELVDEALAQAKLAYSEATVRRMKHGEWEGAPLAVDALLAAAVEAGLDARAGRRAIAAPTLLDGSCPRCGGALEDHQGRRVCGPDGDGCGWDEADGWLVGRDATPARATVDIVGRDTGDVGLQYRQLPDPADLPDAPLITDATATPEKVAGLYGVPVDDVRVEGDEPLAANLQVTQVLDGQYHAGTILKSMTDEDGERLPREEWETLADRIQSVLEKIARVHDRPLVVARRKILQAFDIPDGVETLHYHATRGLNRAECDAVVSIGGPHPRPDDLRHDAALLAQGHDDLDAGGVEHSTRRDEDGSLAANPPVYRKLRYADADGVGRAVATKHFTGLTGALFREGREKELEQAVHRIRPLLADETKHAYLLTNVPTDLPIDEVCSFDELADPLAALFPVDDRALELAAELRDAIAGEPIDGFRAELLEVIGGERTADDMGELTVDALHRLARLRGLDVSERTVRRWVEALVEVGLLAPGEYEHRQGVPYEAEAGTLTEALRILSNNASVEVAVRRRVASLAAEFDSAREWLAAAQDLLGVTGDAAPRPAVLNGGDRPPDDPV